MAEFDFTEELQEVKWIVEGLIPSGQLCIFLAQAGIGKSLVVEDLAVSIVYGEPFCGLNTIASNVLIIDQDTPSDTIRKRLKRFSLGKSKEKEYSLYLESMGGYSLATDRLFNVINDYQSAKLVIIDSLHSVCGRLNPNHTVDMGVLAKLKKECLTPDRTIIINHHITEKTEYTVDLLMAGDTHKMSMGASAIIQQADTYYIIGASAENGVTEKVYIRPVAKRQSIPTKPIILQMLQLDNGGERLEYAGKYEPEFGEVDKDIMTLFREQNVVRTVKEVYESLGHRYGEGKVRTSLAELEQRGYLALSRHHHDLFKYRLP